MKYLTLLGSTGSIGCNTLDVVRYNPEQYKISALVAGKNVNCMAKQCLEFNPRYAVMDNKESARQLKVLLASDNNNHTEVLSGQQAACEMAALEEVDQVIAAIVGTAGLLPTMAAVNAGKTILLANKESLVICGRLFMEAVKQRGARILPIDSEHSAIFQTLPQSLQQNLGCINLQKNGISSILLTGSGGPFRNIPLSKLSLVTPEQACCHPNWSMGRKISVDSATMMNKGLEYVEACWLFNASAKQIEILVHPQSIIHSMVRYLDGSILAQLSKPDMRIPIAYAMSLPQRIKSGVKSLDFCKLNSLTFRAPNYNRYPCLKLALQAFNNGQAAITTLNAANEVAVSAFLSRKISFTEIAILNLSVLEVMDLCEPNSIEATLAIDAKARIIAQKLAERFASYR